MRQMYLEELEGIAAFAKKAAECFSKSPSINTYTDSGSLHQGELFAIRWGLGDDCVVVFRTDEDFEPINFNNLVKEVTQ